MAKKHKRDRRTKKDYRLAKARLVKQGRCRQCGRKRDGKSKSRCKKCLGLHNQQIQARYHRPATATRKGRAKVAKREGKALRPVLRTLQHTPRPPRPSELRARAARERIRMAQVERTGRAEGVA